MLDAAGTVLFVDLFLDVPDDTRMKGQCTIFRMFDLCSSCTATRRKRKVCFTQSSLGTRKACKHDGSHTIATLARPDAVRRVNLLTLAFALHFPAFERLRSTHSLASFSRSDFFWPFYAAGRFFHKRWPRMLPTRSVFGKSGMLDCSVSRSLSLSVSVLASWLLRGPSAP